MNSLFRKIGFFTAFIIPTLVIVGFYLGAYWNFLSIFFSFILMPLIDQSTGTDTSNVSERDFKQVSEAFYYRFVTYVWAFFQLMFLFWGAYAISSAQLSHPLYWIGFTLSFALVTG